MEAKYCIFLVLIAQLPLLYSAQISNESTYTVRLVIRRVNDCSQAPNPDTCMPEYTEVKEIPPHQKLSLNIPQQEKYYAKMTDAYTPVIGVAIMDQSDSVIASSSIESPTNKNYSVTVTKDPNGETLDVNVK